MTRPTGFGAECEHGRLARECERCDDADEIASLRDCAKQYEQWLAQDQATIADLRDRLRIMARVVCDGCGCATQVCDGVTEAPLCCDCLAVDERFEDEPEYPAACVSVGLRALCGRRLLGGCE